MHPTALYFFTCLTNKVFLDTIASLCTGVPTLEHAHTSPPALLSIDGKTIDLRQMLIELNMVLSRILQAMK